MVRYVDDFALFGENKEDLWRWREGLMARLATLRLTIHPGCQPKPVAEGIPFLGFLTYPDKRRLKRRKGIHYQRQLKRLVAEYEAGLMPLDKVTASVQGWVNHLRYGNTVGLREAILGQVQLQAPQTENNNEAE